jgi:hypothetical protein
MSAFALSARAAVAPVRVSSAAQQRRGESVAVARRRGRRKPALPKSRIPAFRSGAYGVGCTRVGCGACDAGSGKQAKTLDVVYGIED